MIKNSRMIFLLVVIITGIIAAGCSREVKPLTIISFGGSYQEAQSESYIKPFSEEFQITVQEGNYNGDYALLEQRALARNGSWDVVSVESAPAHRGEMENIFLPIPESVFNNLNLIPASHDSFLAGHLVFSTILAYNTAEFTDANSTPQTWADFWDLNKFPGKRGLRNNPRGTLEIALLATGCNPSELYPLDVERALEKLDELWPNIVWWESGAQPIKDLADNKVAMTSVYNGRIWFAKNEENMEVGWSMNHGLMEIEYWAVPKNAPNPQQAFDFIKYSLSPNAQANFSNRIAYGPTNLDAVPFVHADVIAALPNSEQFLELQVLVNANWWAENEQATSARWEEWRSGKL